MPRLAHALSWPNDKPSTGHYKITQFCYLPRYCRRYSTECLADHTALGDKNEGNRLTVIATGPRWPVRLFMLQTVSQTALAARFALTMTVRLSTRCLTKSTAWIRTRIMAAIPVPARSVRGRMKHWKVHRCRRSKASGSGRGDSALAGRDWHSPANLNDGAATSSMSLLDKP